MDMKMGWMFWGPVRWSAVPQRGTAYQPGVKPRVCQQATDAFCRNAASTGGIHRRARDAAFLQNASDPSTILPGVHRGLVCVDPKGRNRYNAVAPFGRKRGRGSGMTLDFKPADLRGFRNGTDTCHGLSVTLVATTSNRPSSGVESRGEACQIFPFPCRVPYTPHAVADVARRWCPVTAESLLEPPRKHP
jgi:hypothetical protein